MIKNILLVSFLFMVACSGNQKEEKLSASPSASKQESKHIDAFTPEQIPMRVSELKLNSKEDTVSYALGIAWAHGMGRIGVSKISNAFYLGAHDYTVHNPSFTTVAAATARLDKETAYLKADTAKRLDVNQKLGDVKILTRRDTLSYMLGYAWMKGAFEIGVEKITPALLVGLESGLFDNKPLYDYASADHYLRAYVENLRAEKFYDIKQRNEAWLAENKSKKDVVTLPSGLQYKIIKQGNGKSPRNDNDAVVCNYRAKLIDNTVFESTYETGQHMKAFPSGVVPAWREALPRMKAGSVWELYVPYHLGYGSGGIQGKVPPFATLIYELELVDVETKVQ